MMYRENQGWHVVQWTLEIEPGVHYAIDVEENGSAIASFVTRDGREALTAFVSLGDAMAMCARHAERNEVQALVPGGWRASSWSLAVHRHPRRGGHYVIDVDPEGAARAVYASHDEHVSLGVLPDLGHAISACHKAENARVFPSQQRAG